MFYCFMMMVTLTLYIFKKIQLQTVLIMYGSFIPIVLATILYRLNNLEVVNENIENDKK